ncbi:MAG: hypothetical protein IT286_04895 [Proteobacteria bacterium]|nr:hypothetical protein [Pseudomonadota bacterium]
MIGNKQIENTQFVYFIFQQPIKTQFTQIQTASLICPRDQGLFGIKDDSFDIEDVLYDLGDRITILRNYIQPEMTKEQQLAAYINRLKYLLSLLNGGSQSTSNSYVGIGYGVGGVGGNQSGIGASSGPGGNSGSSSQGNTQSAIDAEIADLIKKINQFLQDPELKKFTQEGSKTHDQIEEIQQTIPESNTLSKKGLQIQKPASGNKITWTKNKDLQWSSILPKKYANCISVKDKNGEPVADDNYRPGNVKCKEDQNGNYLRLSEDKLTIKDSDAVSACKALGGRLPTGKEFYNHKNFLRTLPDTKNDLPALSTEGLLWASSTSINDPDGAHIFDGDGFSLEPRSELHQIRCVNEG